MSLTEYSEVSVPDQPNVIVRLEAAGIARAKAIEIGAKDHEELGLIFYIALELFDGERIEISDPTALGRIGFGMDMLRTAASAVMKIQKEAEAQQAEEDRNNARRQ